MAFFTTFLVKVYMWNVIVHRSTTPIVANNQLECTRLCYRNATCSSFFFSQEDSSCHLHNSWIQNVSKSRIPTGTHYYQVTPDKCSGFGYQSIGNMAMCVKFSTESKIWENAKVECESEGARLVKLDTEEKNNAVLDILKKDYHKQHFFIGLYDPEHNKQFIWTDGSTLEYTHWVRDEPDNSDYYVSIVWYTVSHQGWYGKPYEAYYKYICEKVLNL